MPVILEQRVGRLVVFRLIDPIAAGDWPGIRATMAQVVEPMEQCVFCCDWRAMREEQSDAVLVEIAGMLSSDNPKLARSGILIEPSPFMLQLSHTVIKAANPHRRLVYTQDELRKWLEPALTEQEKREMESFLAELG